MNPITIRVDVGDGYDVIIGEGPLSRLGELLSERTPVCKSALITDQAVGELFAMQVDTSLARAGFVVTPMAVPPGETSKTWQMAGDILETLAKYGLGREDLMIALGGGVVGDLAGFVASVYMRGISFVQVPTTLLAMVDSSVGGKTAVDLSAGKNLAGSFKQPLVVVADISTLTSLPDEEWRSGLAEVAKSAVIDGEEFTGWLEAHAKQLLAREAEVVAEAVRRCVEFKARIVAGDEREEGPRECLNYGHTLGHAIEKVAGYGEIAHGLAVAEGMRFEARVAMDVGEADAAFVKRQDRLLDALGMPPLGLHMHSNEVLSAMRGDKKARGGAIRMVLPGAPGQWQCSEVVDEVIDAHLEAWSSTKEGDQR
jgi:3-dehydroquinate synthase